MMTRLGAAAPYSTPMTFGKRYQSKTETNKKDKDPMGSAPEWAGMSLAGATVLGLNGLHNINEPIGKGMLELSGLQVALSTALYADTTRIRRKPTEPEPEPEVVEVVSEAEPAQTPEAKTPLTF